MQVTSVPKALVIKAILTYQQIVCEQHRLIENHLAAFTVRVGDESEGLIRAGVQYKLQFQCAY